jgi:hypothetical protein
MSRKKFFIRKIYAIFFNFCLLAECIWAAIKEAVEANRAPRLLA